MTYQFDINLIHLRGGNVCGSDRFSIEACEHCQGHYLYNDELKDVYYDPDNLGRRFFRIEAIPLPPCRYCGQLTWRFSSIMPDRISAQAGPWGWALSSRQFTFVPEDMGEGE